jgi:hypothetical protein
MRNNGGDCEVAKGYRVHLRLQLPLALIALSLVIPQAETQAAEAAYWRHEDGTVGSIIPDGPDTVLDSSGNGNHMQTFSSGQAPFTAATYSSNVSPLALRSGLPNTLSLDFGATPAGTEDGGGRNDDNYTAGKPIQTQLFTAMTVELAFNMNVIGGYQTLFGHDGKPLGDGPGEIDSPVAPLQIKIRGDDFPNAIPNQLFVEWIDGDGDIHSLASGETAVAGEWVHLAFTLTDSAAELWVAGETGDYLLKDAISGEDFAGALGPGEVTIFEPAGFSIGRGMFNNGVTDWSDALIDEVRVSDVALTPDQFLFVTAPGLEGDYNGDGSVNAADYTVWRDNPAANGGAAGYTTWAQNYGDSTAPAVSVPEPTSAVLVAGLLLASSFLPRKQ